MMKQAIHMTHNRLVAGSNPAGATKFSDKKNIYLSRSLKRLFCYWLFEWRQSGDAFSLPWEILS